MDFTVGHAREILARTPRALSALLEGISDDWARGAEHGEAWSPFDIVGHLIHGERTDWVPRARIILERGESRPFDPYDRFAQERESAGKSMDELLHEFATLRERNVVALGEFDDLGKTGTHPEFGVVTLRELLATWVAHDLSHLRQIARVMAKRYTTEVGPWRAYLPVLG